VLRKIWTLIVGSARSFAVEVPPVQLMTTSPTFSAKPSPRTSGGLPALAVQTRGTCALAMPATTAITARSRIAFLKSTISFSL